MTTQKCALIIAECCIMPSMNQHELFMQSGIGAVIDFEIKTHNDFVTDSLMSRYNVKKSNKTNTWSANIQLC